MGNKEKNTTQKGSGKRLHQLAERARQGNLRSTREQVVFLYFLVVFILVSVYLDRGNALPDIDDAIAMSAGWTIESGDAEGPLTNANLSGLPTGNLELTADVSGLATDGKSLCMKSIDTVFDVYADGMKIYSYRPTIPKRLGKSYGMYVHTVPIPENTATLGLRLEPVFHGAPAALSDVMIEDGGAYMRDMFSHNLLAFGRSTVILLIGLLFLTVGIFGKILMNTAGLDFISFGILCVLVGFTGYNDTLLLQVLTRRPSLIRVITYVCLMFMPYPAMSFFASATGNSHTRLVTASLVLSLGNFACQLLLTHRGVTDYYYLVYISHALILLTFVAIIFLLVRAARRHSIQKELLRCLMVGILAMVLSVCVDILRYYVIQSFGSSSCTRLGCWCLR